jgi:hypothetical protein
VQAVHVPALQTWLVPQPVPFATGVRGAVHFCVPVAHEYTHVWQESYAHVPPAVHAAHDPPLHTWSVPQDVPLATGDALVQVETPMEHDVVPVWQTLPFGLHDWPAVHDTHCPLLQTWLVPHAVPLATGVELTHVCVPVAHEYVPLWHASTMHAPPAVHAAHDPALQTMLVPHDVPFAVFVRLAQLCEPVAHEYVPDWQALPDGLQAPPAVQETHEPELHT